MLIHVKKPITKFDDLPIKQQLISYLVATFSDDAIAYFATSDIGYQAAAKELINEGLLIDRTEEAFAPGSLDRAYSLTEKGKKELLP